MAHPVPEQGRQEPLWFGCDSPWDEAVGSCPLFYLHPLHLLLAAPFPSPAPNLTTFLVAAWAVREILGMVFQVWGQYLWKCRRDGTHPALTSEKKNLYFKKSEIYNLQLWRDTLQDLFCLIQDSLQVESFPAGKYHSTYGSPCPIKIWI